MVMKNYTVAVLRTERTAFDIKAETPEAARDNYLSGGDETGSETVSIAVERIEGPGFLWAALAAEATELQNLVADANRASFGDSNDDEIEKLRDALEAALARWPEVDKTEGSENPDDDEDDDEDDEETELPEVPADFPIKGLTGETMKTASPPVTCNACGRSWDDDVSTSYTPAPSGRCPFEAFHA